MTGLHLHLSHRIEALAAELASHIERERARDPFQSSLVAVGSTGMKRWLHRALAHHAGISFNVRFAHPTRVLHDVLAELEDEPIDGERFEPAALRFEILAVLEDLLRDVPEAADLARFSVTPPCDRATLGLAGALADALDRLVHYRPELVAAGFAGEHARGLEDDPALSLVRELFRRLEARLGETHLLARLQKAAARMEGVEAAALPPLHVFGVSFLPPIHLRIFEILAARRPVHLYAVVPSREYFGDVAGKRERVARELEGTFDVDLPLLSSWGKMSREFIHLLYGLDRFVEDRDLFHDVPSGRTVLSAIQRDLLELRPSPSTGHTLDESVEVHACFGPLRQVEALRERLLAAFSADPSLMPWEVAVLTPDIEIYAPLVRSVFAEAREGLPEIPVEIADVSLVRRAPEADFLLRFLRFAAGRPTVTALAELLEHRAAAPRFGLAEDDLSLVHALLAESAMHYGTGDDPEGETPISPIHTLRAGLRRITLGALLPDDAPALAGVAPLPGLDGEHLRVALALVEAIELYLEHRAALRARPRAVSEWVDELVALLADVFRHRKKASGYGDVLRALGALRREASGFEGALTLDALVSDLEARLAELGERLHAQRGGVVLSRLTPMRAVPYRVVAVLGLDEATFPRREKQPSFDLVAKAPRLGDRDASSESRHLLLEALLAARERFLVFYDGRDPRTLDDIPPPTAVEDLLETLSRMTGTPRDVGEAKRAGLRPLVVEHPLQPFGAFSPGLDPAARSHSPSMREAAARLLGDRRPPPGPFPEGVAIDPREPAEEIDLDELRRFFRDPHGYLLGKGLRARLPEEAEALDDREPLEPDGLEKWRVRDEILRARLAGEPLDAESLVARMRAEGRALAHRLDETFVAQVAAEIDALLHGLSRSLAWPSLETRSVSVPLEIDGQPLRVEGTVPCPVNGQLVYVFASSAIKPTDRLRAMLDAVCLALGEPEPTSVEAVHLVASKGSRVELPLLAEARAWLEGLVRVYLDGRRRALRLFPRSSFAVAEALAEGKGALAAARAGSREYFTEPFSGAAGEFQAPATQLFFADDPFFAGAEPHPEALDLAALVFGPLVDAPPEGKKTKGRKKP